MRSWSSAMMMLRRKERVSAKELRAIIKDLATQLEAMESERDRFKEAMIDYLGLDVRYEQSRE